MYFDQPSDLLLPDGTQLASVGRRIGAYFLAIPLAIVTLGIGYIIWGLIVWGNGQTPALQVLGMRCWRPETNRVPGFWFMALREIVGGIVTGILGFITEITSFVLFVTGRAAQGDARLHRWHGGALRPEQGSRQLTILVTRRVRLPGAVGDAVVERWSRCGTAWATRDRRDLPGARDGGFGHPQGDPDAWPTDPAKS